MTTEEIIQPLIDKIGISIYRFEKEIGIGQSTLDKAMKRNTPLSEDIKDKIVARFEFVSRNYLDTGRGEMMLPIQAPPKTQSTGRQKIYSQSREEINKNFGSESGYAPTPQEMDLLQRYRNVTGSLNQEVINMMVLNHETEIKAIKKHLNLA